VLELLNNFIIIRTRLTVKFKNQYTLGSFLFLLKESEIDSTVIYNCSIYWKWSKKKVDIKSSLATMNVNENTMIARMTFFYKAPIADIIIGNI